MIAPPITIAASSLTQTPQRIVLAQPSDTVWYPPVVVVNGQLVTQSNSVVIGVQINSAQAPVLPFGLMGDNLVVFRQRGITEIWVSLLSSDAAPAVLMAGSGIGVGYSKGVNFAGAVSAGQSFGLW